MAWQVVDLSISADIRRIRSVRSGRIKKIRVCAVLLGERTAPKWRVTVEMDIANEDRASRMSMCGCQSHQTLTPNHYYTEAINWCSDVRCKYKKYLPVKVKQLSLMRVFTFISIFCI